MSTFSKNSTPWTHWPCSESKPARPKGTHADIHNDAATLDIKDDSLLEFSNFSRLSPSQTRSILSYNSFQASLIQNSGENKPQVLDASPFCATFLPLFAILSHTVRDSIYLPAEPHSLLTSIRRLIYLISSFPYNRQPNQQKLQTSGTIPCHLTLSSDHRTHKMMQAERLLLPPLFTQQYVNGNAMFKAQPRDVLFLITLR